MAVVNGKIPISTLVKLSVPGHLRSDAARSFELMRDRLPFLSSTSSADAYRSYNQQVNVFLQRYRKQSSGYGPYGDVRWWNGVRYVRQNGAAAAVPGTSNHGLGVAIDLSGLGGFSGSRYKQLAAIAGHHGWSNAEGRYLGEPWHWVYNPANDKSKGETAKPVKSHYRWATAPLNVRTSPGGQVARSIKKGSRFKVVDGSGKKVNNLWWVKTTSGNWVADKYTTKKNPKAPKVVAIPSSTIKEWQKQLGTPVDGKISTPSSRLIAEVQKKINDWNTKGKFLTGGPLKVTGKFDHRDRVALIKALNWLDKTSSKVKFTAGPLSTTKDLTSSRRAAALKKTLDAGLWR